MMRLLTDNSLELLGQLGTFVFENVDRLMVIIGVSVTVVSIIMMALRTRTYLMRIPKFVHYLPIPHRIVGAIGVVNSITWLSIRLYKNDQAQSIYVDPWALIILAVMILIMQTFSLVLAEVSSGPRVLGRR